MAQDTATENITLLAQINALYQSLSEDGGMPHLAQMLEDDIGYPVSICDISYQIIAVSEMMNHLPFGIQRTPGGLLLDSSEVESLRRLQIEKKIYEQRQTFLVTPEDHPDTSWAFCAIRIRQVPMGYVAVCLPEGTQLNETQQKLITSFSDVCALEMQRQGFPINRTGLPYESFLIDLFEGRFTETDTITERLSILGHTLGGYYCVIALESATPLDNHLFHRRQVMALRNQYPKSLAVVYKDHILLLLNQDQPVLLSDAFLNPLQTFCVRNDMIAGISQPFADIIKIRSYYHQALHTLELSDTSDPSTRLYHSTDALLPYLFSNCDYSGLQIGIHHHIYQLIEHDRQYHTDFIKTLRTYLNCDRNAALAASSLHIHRSTFFYRIKKIEDLLDVSITDSHLLFLYELSFYILDYLSR